MLIFREETCPDQQSEIEAKGKQCLAGFRRCLREMVSHTPYIKLAEFKRILPLLAAE
jgi:hypothetical protein